MRRTRSLSTLDSKHWYMGHESMMIHVPSARSPQDVGQHQPRGPLRPLVPAVLALSLQRLRKRGGGSVNGMVASVG